MIIDLCCFVIIEFWYHMLTMLPLGDGILISKSGKMLILCTCRFSTPCKQYELRDHFTLISNSLHGVVKYEHYHFEC